MESGQASTVQSFFEGPCVTLVYLELWYIQKLRNIDNPLKHLRCNFIFNEPWHIYDEVFFSEPFVTITYLDFWYIISLSLFRTQDIRYCESSNHSSFLITLCNLDIFITYIYSSSSMLRTREIWWAVFYGTLCNIEPSQISIRILFRNIFIIQGIFVILLSIYYEMFSSKPWHI